MGDEGEANKRWAEMLSLWAIPEEIVAAAPESPYFFDPQVFIDIADEALARAEDTPSDTAAKEALPADGTVLDVGVGAGAASLRLGAATVVGVDSNSALLHAFVERATRVGTAATAVEGRWPDVAPITPLADVAVCHHVAYNVDDLAGFATALANHAARRVVIELTAVHPMMWMAPYWAALYGLQQPDRPIVDDAVSVLEELGFSVKQQRWVRPYQMIGETGDERLARISRRLCLPDERLDELGRLLATTPPPPDRDVATLWW